jgi:hypothetical protein
MASGTLASAGGSTGWASQQGWLRAAQVALLAGLLLTHFLVRLHLHRTTPLEARGFYPQVYRVSLSLLAGNGFHQFRLSDRPESRAVWEFLLLRRPRLSRREFAAFRACPDCAPLGDTVAELARPLPTHAGDDANLYAPLHTTRALDVYGAALVWKLCGIGWTPLFVFYALVSTGACLLVFAIARKLGGGFLPGFLAALLYFASPLEADLTIRSLRDVSPLWFAALAFAAWLYLSERFQSRIANVAMAGGVGALSALGYGWRTDCLLLPPFLLFCLIVGLRAQRVCWGEVAARAAGFLGGSVLVWLVLLALVGPVRRQSPLIGFHMAYYGEYSRCKLLGVENTFQVWRDDLQTCLDCHFAHAARHPDAPDCAYLDDAYGAACAGMYRSRFGYNLYPAIQGFPRFYRHALRACRFAGLPIDGWYYPPLAPAVQALARWNRWSGLLFALGAAVALLAGPDPLRSACLLLFTLYHAAALFAVLPEHKHAGALVLPLCVFGGIGAASPGLLRRVPLVLSRLRARLPVVATAGLALAVAWLLACGLAHHYSTACRQAYLDDILARAAGGKLAHETIESPQLFRATLPADPAGVPCGYLLRIRAGAHPGALRCEHVHLPHPPLLAQTLVTQHDLHPGREQFFFVTCCQGAKFTDPRPHVCTVRLPPEAAVLGCTRVDLAGWEHGPVSTLFYPGQCSPGNPRVHGVSGQVLYGLPAGSAVTSSCLEQRRGSR